MASRVQQQSLWCKIAYFGLIVLLLFAALGVRKMTDDQAVDLKVREQDLGEVELTDKAIRLTLTGSRGIAVCGLWYAANEKQKKHEWNELELLVRSLIKLQPHFVSPWLFQSWNLAYNVSVECDRVKDKYFYIARGIGLLAQGDRLNRDNCDMRHFVGFYIQNKMGSSDERNTLRTLFQLSCVNPSERRPEKFRQLVDNRTVIDWNAFEEFCRRHPHVVRRIRDKLPGMKTPDDIIDFLASSQKIPSLYEDTPQSEESERESAPTLRPLDDRFPILPPRQQFDPNELTYEASELGDDFDNFSAARAWFGYAQDPVVITKVRRPKYMSQVIFESQPQRAQGYFAEFQESEGWFDREGWEIKDWFPRDKYHPEGAKRSVVVGDGVNWAGDAWDKAYQMYNDFGVRRGLYKTAEELQAMTEPERSEYEYNRSLTNFPHFYAESDVERTKEAVTVRQILLPGGAATTFGRSTACAGAVRKAGSLPGVEEDHAHASRFPSRPRDSGRHVHHATEVPLARSRQTRPAGETPFAVARFHDPGNDGANVSATLAPHSLGAKPEGPARRPLQRRGRSGRAVD